MYIPTPRGMDGTTQLTQNELSWGKLYSEQILCCMNYVLWSIPIEYYKDFHFQFELYFTYMYIPIHCVCLFPSASGSKETGVELSEESPLPPSHSPINMSAPPRAKPFTPFCNVDQSQISIHCHINAVRTLLCVPGLVPQDVGEWILVQAKTLILCVLCYL